jgi:hypothetical protein
MSAPLLLTYDQLRAKALQSGAICAWHISQLVRCDPANPDVQSQLDYYEELLWQVDNFARFGVRPKLPVFPTLLFPDFPTSPPLIQSPPPNDKIVTYDVATGAIIQVDWV